VHRELPANRQFDLDVRQPFKGADWFQFILPAAAEVFVKGDDGQKVVRVGVRARLICEGKSCC